MKREGRQHGMVRSYRVMPSPWNPRPETRVVNGFNSPPTAGLFTKVSTKPTNHSKFTGKCGKARCFACHVHPATKSKDKAKGTQKLRSCDVVSNHRLVSWRVVDSKPGLKLSGFSATGILDQLGRDDCYLDNYDGGDDDDECLDEVYEESCDLGYHGSTVGFEIGSGAVDIEIKGDDDDNENNGMSFCDVALVWEQVDVDVDVDVDEGWCLVGEM